MCGAELTAPQPYTSTGVIGAEVAAECLGLNPADVCTTLHPPTIASTGSAFCVVELASMEALQRTGAGSLRCTAFDSSGTDTPDIRAILCYFRHSSCSGQVAAARHIGDTSSSSSGVDVSSRMFTRGGWEDPATGSASCALVGLLASLQPEITEAGLKVTPQLTAATSGASLVGGGTLSLRIAQGVEMGRPSVLVASAEHDGAGGVGAVTVGGTCVPMMKGELVCSTRLAL